MAKKILIVDDSSAFRELEQRLLACAGYGLMMAADGVEAVRLALAETPDLVLLDLQMPALTGQRVLDILKNNPRTRGIPVVVVSTLGSPVEREKLERAGAASYITKPVNGHVLLATVRKLIG